MASHHEEVGGDQGRVMSFEVRHSTAAVCHLVWARECRTRYLSTTLVRLDKTQEPVRESGPRRYQELSPSHITSAARTSHSAPDEVFEKNLGSKKAKTKAPAMPRNAHKLVHGEP